MKSMKISFFIFLSGLSILRAACPPYDVIDQSPTIQSYKAAPFVPEQWDCSCYFDTSFLKNTIRVRNQLILDGFQEGFFSTQDAISINYLYLERPNATHTVICACGWFPGKKEGIATFFPLLPETANVLFFDARGHGKSSGSLVNGLWTYGKHEYKDILGAIDFINKRTNKPIFLMGICAGAFNITHALLYLEDNNAMQESNIAGAILDSCWGSVTRTSHNAPAAHIKEASTRLLGRLFGKDKKRYDESKLVTLCMLPIKAGFAALHKCFFWPILRMQEKDTNLFDKISKISIPLFFIHTHDDTHVLLEDAQKLASRTRKKMCWWIQNSSRHACNHLKHKYIYRSKMRHFLSHCLTTDS